MISAASVNNVLIKQKPQKSPQLLNPCHDRCDFEPSVLLVFYKCSISPLTISCSWFTKACIENQKRTHSNEAALKSAWLVIHSPLVAHVIFKSSLPGRSNMKILLRMRSIGESATLLKFTAAISPMIALRIVLDWVIAPLPH